METEKREKSIEERIIDRLIKKGFETEIITLQCLKNNDFSVVTQYPFIDPTTKKIRSIDVQGQYTQIYSDEKVTRLSKSLLLFIECKKSDNEKWVFYTEPTEFLTEKIKRDFHMSSMRHKSMLGKLERKYYRSAFPKSRLGLIQTTVMSQDNFNEAQMQVLKAIWFYLKNAYPKGNYNPNFEQIIPVIVFEGQIFEYWLSSSIVNMKSLIELVKKMRNREIIVYPSEEKKDKEKHEFNIEKVQHISFFSNGIPEDPAPVLIDVVTLNYFPEYLKLIKKEFEKLPGI